MAGADLDSIVCDCLTSMCEVLVCFGYDEAQNVAFVLQGISAALFLLADPRLTAEQVIIPGAAPNSAYREPMGGLNRRTKPRLTRFGLSQHDKASSYTNTQPSNRHYRPALGSNTGGT